MEPNFLKEGRREYDQERFFNSIFNHNYLPFIIFTFYSFNIKENHLTIKQIYVETNLNWQNSTRDY